MKLNRHINNMRIILKLFLFSLVLTIISCSGSTEAQTALIKGKITVADSIDTSGNYSGISVTVIQQKSDTGDIDTLYYALTGSDGGFQGTIEFEETARYSAILGRNGRNFGILQLLVAPGDTITVTGELPSLDEFEIDSREERAMRVYDRVSNSFARVAAFINAGRIPEEDINGELRKFSDLFWDIKNNQPGTVAAELSANEAFRLLQGWDDARMMSLINEGLPDEGVLKSALIYGKNYQANTYGLDAAVKYLDSLGTLTSNKSLKSVIGQLQVKILADSSEVDKALEYLAEYKASHIGDVEAQQWVEKMDFDLNNLSEGKPAPSYSFTLEDGSQISTVSPNGKPRLIEIAPLTNIEYQQQYERVKALFLVYQLYGVEFYTLPLDRNQVTIDAFFEERGKLWPIAQMEGFSREELVEKYNLSIVPAWILIDKDGNMIGKYEGNDFENLTTGLNKVANN